MKKNQFFVKPSQDGQFTVAQTKGGEILNSTETYPKLEIALKHIRGVIEGFIPREGVRFKVWDLSRNWFTEAVVHADGKAHFANGRKMTNKEILKYNPA